MSEIGTRDRYERQVGNSYQANFDDPDERFVFHMNLLLIKIMEVSHLQTGREMRNI